MEILLKRTSVWLHHCLHKYEVHIFVIVIYHRLNLKLFFKINFLNDSKKKKKEGESVPVTWLVSSCGDSRLLGSAIQALAQSYSHPGYQALSHLDWEQEETTGVQLTLPRNTPCPELSQPGVLPRTHAVRAHPLFSEEA